MAIIYEQAYLAITASSSPFSDKSFPVKRDSSLPEPVIINCLDSGQPTIVKARPVPSTGLHDWLERAKDPWDMRAWTLQEKVLSTRLISYSADEL
ncbi:hypothetical protein G7Y89_g14079 [Cudoniella acicularis]|uniref:Heterokaryon incompatibility domain-containing protein n=1 Tax=Cudoniella acicularis TaxID=354080 RepID=A0A8H4R5Q6_9HELO|nr:hypothetical protein G7Y89_g14079 [Cudoniella acicularis]